MRFVLGCGLAVVMAVAAGGAALADEKIDEQKLIGKWSLKDLPAKIKVTVEFAKEGKLSIAVDADGKTEKVEGTYKLDGDKLTVTTKLKEGDQTNIMTVKKLTDTEFVTVDEDKKEETFLRIKEKDKKEK